MPETWDTVAPTYAQDAPQWSSYAEEALRLVAPRPEDRLLEIAAGPGTLAFAAASRAAHVDAVDFSPGMIAEIEARAARDGVKNVTAAVMDAQSLSFSDATFDAAFCLFGFFFFPDRARAFREMHRVLRPGGRALIATWSPIERRPFMKVAFEAFAEALPQLPRPSKGELQDPADCVREMREAGFRDVAFRTFSSSVRIESPEHYLELMAKSAAPIAVMKKKQGEEAWNAMKRPILAALEKRLPTGRTDLSAEAILTYGSR